MESEKKYNLLLTEREIRTLIDCLYYEAIKSQQNPQVTFLVKLEGRLFEALTRRPREG